MTNSYARDRQLDWIQPLLWGSGATMLELFRACVWRCDGVGPGEAEVIVCPGDGGGTVVSPVAMASLSGGGDTSRDSNSRHM